MAQLPSSTTTASSTVQPSPPPTIVSRLDEIKIIAGVSVPIGLLLLAVLIVLVILVVVLVWRRLANKSYEKQFIHVELSEKSKEDEVV